MYAIRSYYVARQIGCLELFLAHVRGIEVSPQRFRPDTLDERPVAVETIPGAVVDFREPAYFLVGDRIEPLLVIITECLPPEEIVHDLRGFDQQSDRNNFV